MTLLERDGMDLVERVTPPVLGTPYHRWRCPRLAAAATVHEARRHAVRQHHEWHRWGARSFTVRL